MFTRLVPQRMQSFSSGDDQESHFQAIFGLPKSQKRLRAACPIWASKRAKEKKWIIKKNCLFSGRLVWSLVRLPCGAELLRACTDLGFMLSIVALGWFMCWASIKSVFMWTSLRHTFMNRILIGLLNHPRVFLQAGFLQSCLLHSFNAHLSPLSHSAHRPCLEL